jgi:hypothetical protein
MQAQLRETNTDLNIEIVGINRAGEEEYNTKFTAGRSLPWLQDTAQEGVWSNRWQVVWRDVFILDGQNRPFAVYNLSDHDLAIPLYRNTLKQLFISAAKLLDSDLDGLADDWELRYFGDLSARPEEDADGDGFSNFTEFALGTHPKNPQSLPPITVLCTGSSLPAAVRLDFRRRAGSWVQYHLETSLNLQDWLPASSDFISLQSPKNLFDGTGTLQVVGSFSPAAVAHPAGYLRILAMPRLGSPGSVIDY